MLVLSSAGKCCVGLGAMLRIVMNLSFLSKTNWGGLWLFLQTQAPGFVEASEYQRELLHTLL